MYLVGILLLGSFGGILGAIQAPVNGSLGKHVGPLQATWVSMTGSFLIMACVNLVYHLATSAPFGLVHLGECEPWMLLGGLEGCVVLFGFATCTPRLGVALTSTLAMLGQMATCLVVDAFGLLGTTPEPTNPCRIAGIALFVVGVMLVYRGNVLQKRTGSGAATQKPKPATQARSAASGAGAAPSGQAPHRIAFYVLLILASGIATGIQLPTNVALRNHVGILEALLFHFGLGSLIMLALVLITQHGKLHSFEGVKPWKMSGGVYGVFGVPIMIVVTPVVGTALNSALIALGQLAGAVVVDGCGLLQVEKRRISAWRVAGVALLLVSIVLVTVGRL